MPAHEQQRRREVRWHLVLLFVRAGELRVRYPAGSNVALGYSSRGILGGSVYIAVEGRAELIREKAGFEQHWTPDLDAWFENGVDTPGLVLIEVKAEKSRFGKRTRKESWCSRLGYNLRTHCRTSWSNAASKSRLATPSSWG